MATRHLGNAGRDRNNTIKTDNHAIPEIYNFLFALGSIFATGGCTDEINTNNDSGTDPTPAVLVVRATATDFTGAQPLTRTPVEDGAATRFSAGDAIGLFAIENGVIADGINNIKLTYSGATDGAAGNWEPQAGTTLYWYKDVSYVAYYPYKAGITIDASQTTEQIIASLAANASLQPVADQSDADKYTACDLMTANGTPVNDPGNPARKILTLHFKHQFALLILEPQAYMACLVPADGGFIYRTNSKAPATDPNVKSATINSVNACRMSDGTYRVLVQPTASASQITGSYLTSTDNKKVSFNGTSISTGLAAGYCYKVDVIRPTPNTTNSVVRALAPGDFVFHGTNCIEVYPGNGLLENGKIPDCNDAVGVVVTCDPSRMTDAECNRNGWNHAYVMGLYQEADCKWGPTKAETVIPSVARGSMGNTNGAQFDMNGYTESEAILNTYKNEISNYPVFDKLNTFRTNNPVPGELNNKRSQWFIGSVGQWFDVLLNLGGRSPWTFMNSTSDDWADTNNARNEIWNAINSHLQKANKPLTNVTANISVYYWCSSQYGFGAWRIGFGNSLVNWNDISLRAIPKDNSPGQRAFRPFFAF